MNDPLTDFLLARIAEDEAAAVGVQNDVGSYRAGEPYPDGSGIADYPAYPSYPWGAGYDELQFMERFWPGRVLAECRAKRQIVEQYTNYLTYPAEAVMIAALGWVVKTLALPYVYHKDYQESWKP